MEDNNMQIPEGWQSLGLDEFFSFKYGSNLSTKLFSNSGYPVYGANGIIGYNNAFNYKECQILISCRGENSGLINITVPKSFVTNNSIVCEPKFKLDKYLFFYLLKQIPKTSMVSGSAQPQVVIKDLSYISLFYPKSLTEQKKIAQILSTVDKAIEQTEQLIVKYERIKTGLMQDLLTKGIDENGNIRSEENHEFKNSELGRIPKEWKVDSLYNLCDLIVDCKNRTSPFVDKSIYPVIRTNNIKEGELVWKDMKFTDEKSYKIWTDRAIPKADDVIITREAPLGQVLKIPSNLTPILGQRTMLFRANIGKLMPDYLVFNVLTEKMQLYLNSIAGGSTVHHLKVGEMKAIKIALPVKINEQKRILDGINAQDKCISNLISQNSKLQSIKTGLMQDLLSGKKRVTNLLKEKSL